MHSRPIIVFLEIEGVLNLQGSPFSSGACQHDLVAPAEDEACSKEVRILVDAIAPYASRMQIVISDTSALHIGLSAACSRLPKAIANLVTDSMYLEELTSSSWSDYFSALATRYACIKLWLKRRGCGSDYGWLAIEQGHQLDSWPESEKGHLICGLLSRAGLKEELAIKLKAQDEAILR
jgi:hypothetical protein